MFRDTYAIFNSAAVTSGVEMLTVSIGSGSHRQWRPISIQQYAIAYLIIFSSAMLICPIVISLTGARQSS